MSVNISRQLKKYSFLKLVPVLNMKLRRRKKKKKGII